MKINERGYWENNTTEGHGHDEGLAKSLVAFFKYHKARDVIDIGAGDGYYTNYLRTNNIDCYGYDGNPYTKEITNGLCEVADFSLPQYLGIYDWVLSLEVGEHIPPKFEEVFIENLVRHTEYGMILSWSIPEYGGDGHVNPRPNDYIIEKIQKYSFYYDMLTTNRLRESVAKYPTPCYWFSKTLFVFGTGRVK